MEEWQILFGVAEMIDDTHPAFYEGVGIHSWVDYYTNVDVVDEYMRNEMILLSLTIFLFGVYVLF